MTEHSIAEIVQKIYLGVVNGLITADEARAIINQAGAGLSTSAPAEPNETEEND
jgi:hypothetical protein